MTGTDPPDIPPTAPGAPDAPPDPTATPPWGEADRPTAVDPTAQAQPSAPPSPWGGAAQPPFANPAPAWGGRTPRPAPRLTLGRSLAILGGWAFITLLGGPGLVDPGGFEIRDLPRILGGTIAWNIASAALFVILAGWFLRQNRAWFAAPLPRSARALWLPLLYLILIFGLLLTLGLPPGGLLLVLLLNSLLIGLSEEVMFRGFLYHGLRQRLGITGAVWLSSLVFGAVHVVNALMTGDLPGAFAQSVFAMGLGLVLAAMALRTGSLIWPILYHALWDFGVLSLAFSAPGMTQGAPATGLDPALFLPAVLILPAILHALWLIRRLPRDPQALARA